MWKECKDYLWNFGVRRSNVVIKLFNIFLYDQKSWLMSIGGFFFLKPWFTKIYTYCDHLQLSSRQKPNWYVVFKSKIIVSNIDKSWNCIFPKYHKACGKCNSMVSQPRSCFNIKTMFLGIGSQYKDKRVLRPSFLQNENSYGDNMASLYWNASFFLCTNFSSDLYSISHIASKIKTGKQKLEAMSL